MSARRWSFALAGVSVLVLLLAVRSSLEPSRTTATTNSTTYADTDVVQQYERGERQRVAPFTASLLDGSRLDSRDLLGRPLVVNVWGSWCGPCREEAPVLARVARSWSSRVQFLGLDVRDNPASAQAFERAFDVPYDSVHPDDSPRVIRAFKGALMAAAIPTTVVVDRDGKIAARVIGPVDGTTLRGLIADVLADASATGRSGSRLTTSTGCVSREIRRGRTTPGRCSSRW